jgi:predicted Zn-dependent protease
MKPEWIRKTIFILAALSLVPAGGRMALSQPGPRDEPPRAGDHSGGRGKEWGKDLLAELLSQYQFVKDPEVTSVMNSIGGRIVKAAGGDPSAFRFLVIKDPVPNAFAIPGGYIFIFDSLLSKLRSSRELAGILAHEVAHVQRNHFFKDDKKIMAANLATIAAILLSRGNPAAIMGAAAAGLDLQLQYSRANETEADTYAVQYLRLAGYNPRALLESFQTLAFYEQINSPETPIYFSTHPGLDERMGHLELMLRGSEGVAEPHEDSRVDWTRIVVALRAPGKPVKEIPSLVESLEPEGGGEERKHYLTGLAYLKSGFYADAVPEYAAALALSPSNSVYHGDLAQCYFQIQKVELAEQEARAALDENPDQPSALIVMGRIRAHAGSHREAVDLFTRALKHRTGDAMLNLYLSQSYGGLGDAARQGYYLGRYLRLDLKPVEALGAYRRVERQLPTQSELGVKIHQEMEEIKRDGV